MDGLAYTNASPLKKLSVENGYLEGGGTRAPLSGLWLQRLDGEDRRSHGVDGWTAGSFAVPGLVAIGLSLMARGLSFPFGGKFWTLDAYLLIEFVLMIFFAAGNERTLIRTGGITIMYVLLYHTLMTWAANWTARGSFGPTEGLLLASAMAVAVFLRMSAKQVLRATYGYESGFEIWDRDSSFLKRLKKFLEKMRKKGTGSVYEINLERHKITEVKPRHAV
jgi:hypothetical protein